MTFYRQLSDILCPLFLIKCLFHRLKKGIFMLETCVFYIPTMKQKSCESNKVFATNICIISLLSERYCSLYYWGGTEGPPPPSSPDRDWWFWMRGVHYTAVQLLQPSETPSFIHLSGSSGLSDGNEYFRPGRWRNIGVMESRQAGGGTHRALFQPLKGGAEQNLTEQFQKPVLIATRSPLVGAREKRKLGCEMTKHDRTIFINRVQTFNRLQYSILVQKRSFY